MSASKKLIKRWWEDVPVQIAGQSIRVVETSTGNCKKFNCEQHMIEINFNQSNKTFSEAKEDITNMFIEIHSKMNSLMKNNDKVRITFFHDEFREPIGYEFMNKETLNKTSLQSKFESVVQSYREVKLNRNNALKAIIVIAHTPAGSGRLSSKSAYLFKSQQEYLSSRKYIIPVENNDNFCAARAVLIAIEYLKINNNKNKELNAEISINKVNRSNKLNRMIKKCKFKNRPMGIEEFKKMEVYLIDYQITVINEDGKRDNKKPIFVGMPNKFHIYLSYTGSHYNVINNIKAFYNLAYYCHDCKVAYQKRTEHICYKSCVYCYRLGCEKDIYSKSYCSYCKIKCNNDKCLRLHEYKTCKEIAICKVCNCKKTKKHTCFDQKYCTFCHNVVDIEHKCFILTEEERCKKDKKFAGYIFFDYEAFQENNVHIANLVIAEKICSHCLDEKVCKSNCRQFEFNSSEDFCEWLFSKSNENFTAIAHNMKGYDGVFIMKFYKENHNSLDIPPEVIMNGSKLLYILFRNVRIIDSYSFIPMALSKFTKTFDLVEHKKGFFPHLFNSRSNQNYIGNIPDKRFFGCQYFDEKKLKEFDIWYEKSLNNIYNFKNEMVSYCISDVLLLKHGCLAFRKIIKNITNVDPFKECITIASLCHLIYRKFLMKPKTIGLIPELGYNPKQKTSNKARQWIKYIMYKDNIKITFSHNGGEVKVDNYLVDGYYEYLKNGIVYRKVYEFNGCYWHGCPKCYKGNSFNIVKQEIMSSIYYQHCKRREYIKKSLNNCEFIEKWECEFEQDKKNDEVLQYFLKNICNIQESLIPRDCLYGGRTNALKLYKKCDHDEIIEYRDFTSLYPAVQKYDKFPIGHPEIITDNFDDIKNYFGLIKCKILPPKSLYLPVLPLKINGKLIFTLCATCAEVYQQECNHCDEERALIGSWVSLEVEAALHEGYKIIVIYEIWHYPQYDQYNHDTKSGGLFTDYVNMFLKYKQEASGYPEHVVTDKDKDNYIKEYFEKEGISLEKNNIKYNSGMRSVMKLILNSFWGKFGMKTDKMQVKFINNLKDWYELISNDEYVVHDVDFSIDDILVVYYKRNINSTFSSNTVNVVLASFVTCHARLRLYKELKKLGNRVLYFDTDSIIYSSKKNDEYHPILGDYLGELTNEIDKTDGNYIEEFISAGPKNYAYKLDSSLTKCTIKGFSLNYITSLTINFDSIKEIVLKDQSRKIKVKQLKFIRDKLNWEISTSEIEKLYSFVYDKRVIVDNYDTRPYGY